MTRDRILAEIRRLAKSRGKAPGRGLFERETGIGTGAWLGKYWARWGDAVREAGLTPNELQAAHSEDAVLAKLAAFTLELGRWPTVSECRLRRQTDRDFPSHGTLRRVGTQEKLAARLTEYCASNPKYRQVIEICSAVATAPSDADHEASPAAVRVAGHVYLMKYGRHYKIGHTNSVARRHREVRLELPDETRVVHTIETDDPVGIEAYWHRRFADRVHNGEWFNLTKADVAAFRKRRFQ